MKAISENTVLQEYVLRVMRFTNSEVEEDLGRVSRFIRDELGI